MQNGRRLLERVHVFAWLYNLVRMVLWAAAPRHRVDVERIRCIGAARWRAWVRDDTLHDPRLPRHIRGKRHTLLTSRPYRPASDTARAMVSSTCASRAPRAAFWATSHCQLLLAPWVASCCCWCWSLIEQQRNHFLIPYRLYHPLGVARH